jgi:uncharacterized protein (DUF58 family)
MDPLAITETSSPPTSGGHLGISAVWLRFILSMVGLALAFVAALFSTVSRESGNVWETVIFASVALVLVVLVGITAVPYLAKRVAGSRMRNAVDYQVTKFGIIYVTVVVLIGIAALNTGNNLLYIIVAAMLAAIVVSGVVSATVLRHMELDVRIPDHAFAGEPFRGQLWLKNPRSYLPCFSVSVVPSGQKKERRHWQWKKTTFAFPPMRPPQEQWLRLPDRKLQRVSSSAEASCIISGATYFPYIPSRTTVKANLDLSFFRRGRYQEKSLALASGFPFAFLVKTRHIPLQREIIIYPSVKRAVDEIALVAAIAGEIEAFSRGNSNDLHRLREYVPEDSVRYVDWKATAKTGTVKVREFSREENRKVRVVFDNPAPGILSAKKYEDAVSTVASLAWHLTRTDIDVRYAAKGYDGARDLYDFLKFLATCSPNALPYAMEEVTSSDEYSVIISAAPPEQIDAVVGAQAHVIFIG